jgi:hypothetical protein
MSQHTQYFVHQRRRPRYFNDFDFATRDFDDTIADAPSSAIGPGDARRCPPNLAR